MRTAIDTNVISALWSNEPLASQMASILGSAKSQGGLVICAPVYAELLAYPNVTPEFVNSFLSITGIDIDFDLEETVWREAGRSFADYAQRRRGASREEAKRLLVDFLIGAHAVIQADQLLTLDAARYSRAFPKLRLLP